MCGFAGYIDQGGVDDHILRRMIDSLKHRGPDYANTWRDPCGRVGLAHARLSILDLSSEGNQPMVSQSGRYTIVFNGEIYNHSNLRNEIEHVSWRGHSDTETLLAAFDCWGVKATLEKSNGMFAFAVWDCKNEQLILGRDRFGEKPLYYGWQKGIFYFTSELKALLLHPSFQSKINRKALGAYMRHGYVPGPMSIYDGILKLTPGTVLEVSCVPSELCEDPYWQFSDMAIHGIEKPFAGSEHEALEALEEVLGRSILSQQISDVPIGAFLSGGIDSSTIVALMQLQSDTPIKTFTIGFEENRYNEAEFARRVASHLGTNHTEWIVSAKDALGMIPELPNIYDEPFADSSQVPTTLVCKLAKKHVKVCLSGDAGDELFYGYDRYKWLKRMIQLPSTGRRFLSTILQMFPPKALDRFHQIGGPVLPGLSGIDMFGDKVHKFANIIKGRNTGEVYNRLLSVWHSEEQVVLGAECESGHAAHWNDLANLKSVENFMMALDSKTYLVDDILCKVDRAAMSVSLETRIPFLDHKVAEFAWSLPLAMKSREGDGKRIVKDLLRRHLPADLFDRPKMGFGLPIEKWIRGPLRDWAEDLISETKLRQGGFFNAALVREKWIEHIDEKRNWHSQIWNVLMFQEWLNKN